MANHPKGRIKLRRYLPVRLSLLAAVILLSIAIACAAPAAEAPEPAYDFPILLYQGPAEWGGDLPLSQLEGQPVVLNFWAGLCPPCRAEMPEFQQFQDAFAGRVTLIGVDLGQFMNLGRPEDAQNLLTELGVTYPAGYTADDQVVPNYRVLGLPTTVFITADGQIHRKWDGVLNLEKLTELATEMLE